MLKIQIEAALDARTVRLVLEGRLIRSMSDRLLAAWRDVSQRKPAPVEILVDLKAVATLDDCGCFILLAMRRNGCHMVNPTPFLAAILAQCDQGIPIATVLRPGDRKAPRSLEPRRKS